MDPEIKDLENTLHGLNPAEIPEHLEESLLRIFENQNLQGPEKLERTRIVFFPVLHRLGAAAAVLIAAVGIFFAIINNTKTKLAKESTVSIEASTKGEFVPVKTKNIFEGVRDEGVFLSEDQIPVQGIRYQFSESFLWKNLQDGSEIEIKVPREHLFLLPVKTD